MATVPFSNKTTFLTSLSSRWCRNLEYDILSEAASMGASAKKVAKVGVKPKAVIFSRDLLVGMLERGRDKADDEDAIFIIKATASVLLDYASRTITF
ncbi:hypothetical protein IGI04_041407 [Brassica rapa subsp. trilocularis]|uniref:Uncharacterized protein n=1 Tax=Brassica rapa subsp. trilocularis TaxID=1813537 RepID=A0ABQ7KTJ1_BRACM|nr:hypothetical protein IGI04_041407 [Brassica rapa subsp. trilocularis]